MTLSTTIFLLAGLGADLYGQSVPAASSISSPPAYQILRQDEDWSYLRNADKRHGFDFFDPIKFVPLGADGRIWVSFGGQLRERMESWNQFNFGAPAKAVHNDAFLLSRLLLHTDLHLGEHVRMFVQEKNSLSTHRALVGGRRTLDEDDADLQNAFVEFSYPLSDTSKLALRAGREELLFGQQRVVGPSDWTNTRRAFDGFSANLATRNWNLASFWTRPVVVQKYAFNPDDNNTEFYGIRGSGKLPRTSAGLDLYWLELTHKIAAYNGTSGPERRHTVGGHTYNKLLRKRLDYDAGATYQFGRAGSNNIRAFMLLDQLGFTFTNFRPAPRIYIGFDYASGSHTSGREVGTYNQLFPSAHSTLGYEDIVGRQNVVDLNTGVQLKVVPRITLALDGYRFWRAQSSDALYNKSGVVARPGGSGTSTKLGEEGDLTVKFQADRHNQIVAGYSHFFPGTFFRQSGPHHPEDFAYLSFQTTF